MSEDLKTFTFINLFCLLCFVLHIVLTCIRQENANERYRWNIFFYNTVSQNNEKPHTRGLDDTAIHIKTKITEIWLERKLNTAML